MLEAIYLIGMAVAVLLMLGPAVLLRLAGDVCPMRTALRAQHDARPSLSPRVSEVRTPAGGALIEVAGGQAAGQVTGRYPEAGTDQHSREAA